MNRIIQSSCPLCVHPLRAQQLQKGQTDSNRTQEEPEDPTEVWRHFGRAVVSLQTLASEQKMTKQDSVKTNDAG